MVILIIAGETIFLLPFVLPRIFRPTVLEVFNITNLELGSAFSVYGFIAMFAYFFGGPIADRFPARKLMAAALILTALGGVVLRTIPSIKYLWWIYAFWGGSTILLFWSAMLRYVRIWGGRYRQGSAYGLLDAGRGLVAALLSSLSIFLFSLFLFDENQLDLATKTIALTKIIEIFSLIVFAVGLLVCFFIPDDETIGDPQYSQNLLSGNLFYVFRSQAVWINALIVLCAYVGYKCFDDFSLYAYDVYGYNDLQAALVSNVSFWTRPIAALLAGIAADRLSASKIIMGSFIICILFGVILVNQLTSLGYFFLLFNILFVSLGVYGLRGVYFALVQENDLPISITGTAIGVISVVGFTPDIFMGPLMGYFLDSYPGKIGHQYVFGLLCLFSIVGLIAAFYMKYFNSKKKTTG